MRIETSPSGLRGNRNVRSIRATMVTAVLLLMAPCVANAQSQITDAQSQISKSAVITIKLGPDQIATIKTGERLSTRLSFREPIKEVICGDLYDPASGTGSFVVQRMDRDVFIKPIAPKGISNMFVKTGERGENIYNFSLLIVPSGQAYLIVKVMGAPENATPVKNANMRSPTIAPPITPRIVPADVVTNSANGSVTEGLLMKLWNNTELRQPPPVPKVTPRTRSIGSREPIKRVPIHYPENARMAGVIGEVVVEVTIDEKGKVKSARAIFGHPFLRGPAITAARLWRFNPVDEEDEQAQSVFRISFNFHGRDSANRGPDLTRTGNLTDRMRHP